MPEDENVRYMWSDQKLDEVLGALHADLPVAPEARARARTKLMLAANAGAPTVMNYEEPEITTRTRRAMPLAVVAAAVAVVAVGAVLIVNAASNQSEPANILPAPTSTTIARPPATQGSQHAPLPPAPGQPQNTAGNLAARITAPPLAPGQYLYVHNEIWKRITTEGRSRASFVYIAEAHSDVWMPADQQQQWLMRNQTTSNRQWLVGTEQAARADGVEIDRGKLVLPDGETRARCGAFLVDKGKQPCSGYPVGSVPTMNGELVPPTEPRALYEWLVKNTGTHSDPPLQFFRTASHLLDSRYSAGVRRATLQAMSYHPYLLVADATTKDGRAAISISIDYGPEKQLREEVLLDPANGQVIGRRTVVRKDVDGAKAGETIFDEITRHSVVTKLGER